MFLTTKRLSDDLSRTEPSEFEEERPEYPWPTEEEPESDDEQRFAFSEPK